MARTNHHRKQWAHHAGHDYGSRYKCNQGYGMPYGSVGREFARIERRTEGKRVVRKEVADFSV